jgi:oxygen-independent coproporphyrinogen-3 oxidase
MNADKGMTSPEWHGGLYVHVPFCERKCSYCDFYSVENRSDVEEFLSAIGEEIRTSTERGRGMHVDTVYVGGGTPSVLTFPQMQRIADALERWYTIDPHAEFTIEVNPGTVTREYLSGLRLLGCNRLSIGIQSFDDGELAFLGRIHTADEARRCVADARAAGFENLSLDLITALPGQTVESCVRSLEEAVALQPEHISAYTLIIEEHTPLFDRVKEGRVIPQDDARETEFYETTMTVLERAGFEHYEVSNFARPGRRSRHNSAYWNHTSYFGFGPSAHSFLWKGGNAEARRWGNVRSIGTYCERLHGGRSPADQEETLTPGQLFDEAVFLGLRSDGVDIGILEGLRVGGLTHGQHETLREVCEAGLAFRDGARVRLTPKGFVLCDEICARLLVS